MPCRHPLEAVQEIGSGAKPIIYGRGKRPKVVAEGFKALELPCGQCAGCRLEYARQFAVRIVHEAAWLEQVRGLYSVFVTLTYNEASLPFGGTLVKHHLQDFIKRLRARIAPRKVRYYACGEYGSTCPQHEVENCPYCGPVQRPHYHAIILGFDFPDRYYVHDRDGEPIYCSELLDSVWPFGFHEIGSCTFESAGYVARYAMKKVTGKNAVEHYTRYCPWTNTWFEVTPEFALMSRRPGLGKDFLECYETDFYDRDECPIPGRGVFGTPPRYYDKVFGEKYPEYFEEVKQERQDRMVQSLESGPSLESRGKVQDAKINMLRRKL